MTAERKHNVGALKRTFFGLLTLAASEGVAQPPEPASAQPDIPKGQLAYAGNRDGNWDIYVAASDGSGRKNLTNSPSTEFDPAFSPDGQEIAFSSNRASGDSFELYKMNSDGSGQERILAGGSNGLPAWTPDGRIVMSRESITWDLEASTNGTDIVVINKDGTGLARLGSEGFNLGPPIFHDFGPSVSPDGETVVFSSILHRHGINTFLATLPISGAAPEAFPNVLFDSPGNDDSAAWSPDGGWIAFSSDMGGQRAIYRIRPDGTGLTELVSLPSANLPSWSPDGDWIVFSAKEDGDFDLFAVPAEGGRAIKLFDTPFNEVDPSWAPESLPLSTIDFLKPVKIVVFRDGFNSNYLQVDPDRPEGTTDNLDLLYHILLTDEFGFEDQQVILSSYNRGGKFIRDGERFSARPYDCRDTWTGIEFDAEEIYILAHNIRQQYPNAKLYLVGFSKGGLTSFLAAQDIISDPRLRGLLAMVATVDSPLNGLPRDVPEDNWIDLPEFFNCWPLARARRSTAVRDMAQLWGQLGIFEQNRAAARRINRTGARVLTYWNPWDKLYCGNRVKYGPCAPPVLREDDPRYSQRIEGFDEEYRLSPARVKVVRYPDGRRVRISLLNIAHSDFLYSAEHVSDLAGFIGPQLP